MTRERFADLLHCRLLLEPEAAVLALAHIDEAILAQLRDFDKALDRAIAEGDTEGYIRNNHAFHFTLYRAQPGQTLVRLIETMGCFLGHSCGSFASELAAPTSMIVTRPR